MIPIVLFQSLWTFFRWLVFTSNLISQTTWLKVKLKLVNLNSPFGAVEMDIVASMLVLLCKLRCTFFSL